MVNIASLYTQSFDWLSALGLGGRRVRRAKQTAYGEEAHPLHLAFQRAYRRFAQAHPTWVSRRFDDDFLRQALLTRQMTRQMTRPATRPVSGLAQGRQPSGFVFIRPSDRALALAWDSHFGALAPDEALRSRRMAEVILVANRFLTLLETELGRLDAEPANV